MIAAVENVENVKTPGRVLLTPAELWPGRRVHVATPVSDSRERGKKRVRMGWVVAHYPHFVLIEMVNGYAECFDWHTILHGRGGLRIYADAEGERDHDRF